MSNQFRWNWEKTFDWYDGPLVGIVVLEGLRFYAWVMDRPEGLPEAVALWPVSMFDHELTVDEIEQLFQSSIEQTYDFYVRNLGKRVQFWLKPGDTSLNLGILVWIPDAHPVPHSKQKPSSGVGRWVAGFDQIWDKTDPKDRPTEIEKFLVFVPELNQWFAPQRIMGA